MNEDKLPTGDGEEFEKDPDTNTDDKPVDETPAPSFVHAADVAVPEPDDPADEPAPAAPAPAMGSVRVFPEHYTLLLGGSFLFASYFAVWERESIFGVEVHGTDSVRMSMLAALGIYVFGVSIGNIATGRLKGMMLTFCAGVAGVWIGIKWLLATWNQEACLGLNEMEEKLKEAGGVNFQNLYPAWLGQFAPGVWLATIGGALILFVYVKAILFGGKKKPAPKGPPPARRRGRR